MIRTIIAATVLVATAPALAQSQQDDLDARYDRALAAGYKALFLCSAIGNAEANGASRTVESVERWELTGIDPRFAPYIRDLEHRITRRPDTMLAAVDVGFVEDMPPRIAYFLPGEGCSIAPIGTDFDGLAKELRFGQTAPETPFSKMLPDAEGFSDPYPFDRGDAAALDVSSAFDQAAYGPGARTTAVFVAKDGDILAERYAADFGPDVPQRTWSVAKSIAATLVGAYAPARPDRVYKSAGLGRGGDDPRRAITIDHLLRMASGRYSDTPGNKTDPLYWGGATYEESAQDWPLIHQPGTVFRYANNDTLSAVQATSGSTLITHPTVALFAPLGMRHTIAEDDWKWHPILSSQVWSTARDLARIGQLYLDDGVLPDGTRILPEGWVDYVSRPSGPQPDGPLGYGAGFWLFNDSEGIPPDTFAAMGNRGQYVVIVPSRDLVIVRRGEDPAGHRFDIVSFTRDVLAAIED